jgi:hypothetical protein
MKNSVELGSTLLHVADMRLQGDGKSALNTRIWYCVSHQHRRETVPLSHSS